MKYFELDKEEEKILKDFKNNRLISVEKIGKEKNALKKYAGATLSKTKNINIRLSVKDLHKIKAKAVEQGIPYQTFVSSIIHQFSKKTKIKF